MAGNALEVWLDEPPSVVSAGVGVHGVAHARDVFLLPELWQLHLYGYAADLIVDGVPYAVRPGRISLIPPGARVEYRYRGRSEHLYVHMRMSKVGQPRSLPLIQDSGADAPDLRSHLTRAVAAAADTPRRADAEVWTALWLISRLRSAAVEPDEPHAAVAAAVSYIEANLARPLQVAEIAQEIGISHSHLTRLFRAHTGRTVVAYIRHRRIERARHLLRESTMPIPAIAHLVGIGDLQAFNKACRRELGASPRRLRTP